MQTYTKGDVLPTNVQKAIDSIVNTNLIGKSGLDSNIKYTAGKVVEAMNRTIARNSTITDILRQDELGLKIHQGSRGSIFEEWVRHNHSLGKLGAEEWGELQGKLTFSLEDLKYLDAFKNFKGTRIIGDTHYLDNGATILIEFKHVTGKLSGEPLEHA